MKNPLIVIPAGSFLMGENSGKEDELPVHEVFVDSFRIAEAPVTVKAFLEFLNETDYDFPRERISQEQFRNAFQPVTHVSWFDAQAYCKWMSQTTGERYRLPTEAEWEYVARSGSAQNLYPWGNQDWNERTELHSLFQNGPENVRMFQPNSFGCYDMCLNVHEWCSDWYDVAYYSHSPIRNPEGPSSGTRRASRGGSWRHKIKITRCAARSSIPPGYRYADYGFRVVCEID